MGQNHDGYQRVQLKDGKYLIHRLVAETYLPNPNNLRKATNKPVKCTETGQVFESRTAAANSLGVSKEAIMNCIKGRSKTCGGYHWEGC